jgi:hypothetical protein
MDEIGILPQFTGTLVRDGFPHTSGMSMSSHLCATPTCCAILSSSKRPTRHKKHGRLRSLSCY